MPASDPSPVADKPFVRPGVIRRIWDRWRQLPWWKRSLVHLHVLAVVVFLLGYGFVVYASKVVNQSLVNSHIFRQEVGQWRGFTFGHKLTPVVWFEVDTVFIDPLDRRELLRFPRSLASYTPASKATPVSITALATDPDEQRRLVKEMDRAWAEIRDRLNSSAYRSRARQQ